VFVDTVKTEAPYIAAKREESKRLLGAKWLLHPANRVQRSTPFRPNPVQLNLAYDK
jgi:hypothetical protein